MSRPSLYTEALGDEICERLSSGESAVQIAADPEMPSLRTIMRWAAEDAAFGTEYARAREAQAEVMDDKILSAAKDANADNAAAQRVKIDAYKWRASKLAPKRFGDKLDLTSGGEKITPDAGDAAARAAAILAAARDRKGRE